MSESITLHHNRRKGYKMDTTAGIVVTALLVLVAVTAFLRFQRRTDGENIKSHKSDVVSRDKTGRGANEKGIDDEGNVKNPSIPSPTMPSPKDNPPGVDLREWVSVTPTQAVGDITSDTRSKLMDEAERRHLESLLDTKIRRLRELEKQEAHLGLQVPPHVPMEIGKLHEDIDELRRQLGAVNGKLVNNSPTPIAPGSAPPLPSLIIGRENDLGRLKTRLGAVAGSKRNVRKSSFTVIRGWPGVGKTTVASVLAHDDAINKAFPDGVLWVSLGQYPNIFAELSAWGRALGLPDITNAKTVEEASAQLTAFLRNQRRLLIIDDVWEAQHILPFRIGGNGCALLVTTRLPEVAHQIAPTPDDIYLLDVLTAENALELLRTLAPSIVAENAEASLSLVKELEGLPLAIQVAGRLLHVESSCGFGVNDLLDELREGARLLREQAPADRAELANETIPTVAVLLQKSTDRLDTATRGYFAYLGAFAPKPATFDVEAMGYVWQDDNPKPIIRTLVDRGLLEPFSTGRFWMHALLVMHARSLLEE
jgi:NB-ARC domain